jgi:hypothetical protein
MRTPNRELREHASLRVLHPDPVTRAHIQHVRAIESQVPAHVLEGLRDLVALASDTYR